MDLGNGWGQGTADSIHGAVLFACPTSPMQQTTTSTDVNKRAQDPMVRDGNAIAPRSPSPTISTFDNVTCVPHLEFY